MPNSKYIQAYFPNMKYILVNKPTRVLESFGGIFHFPITGYLRLASYLIYWIIRSVQ